MADYARGNPAHWWRSPSIGSAHRSPASTFISPFRRYTSLLTLTLLVLLIAAAFYITNPQRISRMSANLLSDVLGGPVTVSSARLSLSGTLLLTGVELRTSTAPDSLPLFDAEQIEARFDWLSLLSGQLKATQLTAIRPKLYLIEDRSTGRWNYERLRAPTSSAPSSESPSSHSLPITPRSFTLPVILLRDARVSWAEYDKGVSTNTGRATVDGQLAPDIAVPTMYRFQITERTEQDSGPQPALRPALAGASVSGTWDVTSNRFSAVTSNIALSDSLRRSMPRLVRSWWDEHKLRGSLTQFRLNFDQDDGLTLGADLNRVSLNFPVQPRFEGTVYDLNLTNVRGTLTFGITKPFVRVTAFKGRLLGFDFNADGEFRGFAPESPFDFTVSLPNATLGNELPPLLLAYPEIQDVAQRLDPHGRMDVSVSLKRLSWNGRVFVAGRVKVLDGRMRFAHFPFPLTQLKGNITFDQDYVQFPNLTAMAEEFPVRVSGTAGITPEDLSVDVTVAAENVTFDERVLACLPQKFQRIWNTFDLNATGDFTCRVSRGKELEDPVTISIHINVLDAHGRYLPLPYPVHHATGKLTFEDGQATIKNMRLVVGENKTGVVTINGTVSYDADSPDASLSHNLTIDADVPIDRYLKNGLPDSFDPFTDDTALTGRLTFLGSAVSSPPNQDSIVTGKFTFSDVDLKTKDGIELHNLHLTADLTPEKFTVSKLTATHNENLKVSATGHIDIATKKAAADIFATATDYPLPAEAPPLLPEDARKIWAQYKPSGKLDADLNAQIRFSIENKTDFTVDSYSAVLRPRNLALSSKDWPDSITDLTGTITVKPDRIDLLQMTASSGPLTLAFRGNFVPSTGNLSAAATISSSSLPEKWLALLPEGAATFLKKQKANAKINLDITRLERAASDQPWNFAGSFQIDKFTSEGTWPFAADQLALTGKGALSTKNELDFTGKITGAKLSVSGRTIDTFSATIASNAQQKSLALSNIAGTVADGNLEGAFNLWLDKTPRYEAKLTLADAPLTSLLLTSKSTGEDRKRVGTAKVTAQLSVQESFGDSPDRTGRGQLIVKGGTIYDVPLSMGLMQIATLRLPLSGAFNQASMNYYLRDDKITFERILLESDNINLAGLGTLNLTNQSVNLTFVTESPNEFKFPLFTEILTLTRNQILQLSVTGTLDDPKVMPVPLSVLTKPLQALLPRKEPRP